MAPSILPFSLVLGTAKVGVLLQIEGVIALVQDALALEWRPNELSRFDVPPRLVLGKIQTRQVALADLDAVTYKPGFLGPGRLHLRARNLRALDGLPGATGLDWAVAIARGDRQRAKELTAELSLGMMNRQLGELGL